MTLDELIAWVDIAMERLPRSRAKRDRVGHLRRLYRILDEQGCDWELRREWHALAIKLAKLLGEPEPASPSPPSSKAARPRKPPTASPNRFQSSKWSGPARKRRRRLAAKPEREPIEINPRLQSAFDAVAAGRQILFVTGGAGTGKSTFIRELRARHPEKRSVVLAPTGVAALTAGGQTIHSFCRLPLRPVLPEDAQDAEDPDLVKAIDLMIIDEISMVRADILDGVDAFLRRNRKSDRPFGGVQLVLVGDLFQLPPVVTSRDAELIGQRYASPYFFSAHSLRGLTFFPVELEIVYRQRDASFASLLAAIRDGDGVSDAVRAINERCIGRAIEGQHLILVPTRKAAAMENEARLAELKAKPRTFDAACTGSFITAGEDRLPAPPRLVLKVGAQVMFVRNDGPERRWVNGTTGIVTSLRTDAIGVRLEDGSEHEVERTEWQDIRYAFDAKAKTIAEEIAGTYVQFPLIPAWAVTIHKAQGLTLSRVMVDLDRGAFAEGQVYVALSRCQTIEGLSLRRAVRASEVRCSEAARSFYERIRASRRTQPT
ncbi:MAG TPA: DEAD/DEAH box helicase [Thermoanaerobaculia bacterium]|nr:DEAD/DEAH box helicase [Thermoanaerobaculia bacterium]